MNPKYKDWHWWVAQAVWLALIVIYLIGALAMATALHDSRTPTVIMCACLYALFMIVTMGTIFELFPETIQKYFRNKTPDNPDGCC